jgi:hypothetical protein
MTFESKASYFAFLVINQLLAYCVFFDKNTGFHHSYLSLLILLIITVLTAKYPSVLMGKIIAEKKKNDGRSLFILLVYFCYV